MWLGVGDEEMKFETGIMNLVLKPEDEGDVFNLGIISTKLINHSNFTEIRSGDKKEGARCDSMVIDYKELIKFLCEANAQSI
jgi:hypothetical protein